MIKIPKPWFKIKLSAGLGSVTIGELDVETTDKDGDLDPDVIFHKAEVGGFPMPVPDEVEIEVMSAIEFVMGLITSTAAFLFGKKR